jgi:CubicO group peptidase (beta-lactamase class C family)
VLLQRHLESRTGEAITTLADQRVFQPLQMTDSYLAEPEPGLHGYGRS